MWKKKESDSPAPEPMPKAEPQAAPRPAPAAARRTERAVIGPTLKIRGEVSGEEELLVQGEIDGKVVVKGQGVTVGKSGTIKADIHAKTIRIEGKVRGDLFGEQEVVIETSGDVHGNLIAPSVRLENGARFKGSIDMEQANKPLPAAVPTRPAGASGPKPPTPQRAGEEKQPETSPAAPGQPIVRP